jgi:hypothetical protein
VCRQVVVLNDVCIFVLAILKTSKKQAKMTNEFISISEAVTRYKISQNKVRRLVRDNKGTNHVQMVEIEGKHGFKYLISVAYLNDMFAPLNKAETSLKQSKNEPKTKIKQDNQLDNRLIIQLQETNKQLSDTVTSQQTTIKDLTNTLQEQNKIIVAQSLQIHRISEPTTERWTEPPPPNKKIKQLPGSLNIELLIITILVVCIVIVIAYLLRL